MESYCGSVFWDLNITWYTDDPDVTPCFQNTVLVWMPCAFLWLLATIELIGAFGSRARNVPWTFLNSSKCGISSTLALLQLIELAFCTYSEFYMDGVIYPVDRYTPIIKILTFCLALFLDIINKIHGVRSSGTLFIFWLIYAVCDVPNFRSAVRNPENHPKFQHIVFYLLEVISFPLILAQLSLNCWADAAPEYDDSTEIQERPCPEKGSSFLNRMFFFWFEGLCRKGYNKTLSFTDLWNLNPEDSTRVLNSTFDRLWGNAQKKATQEHSRRTESTSAFSKTGASVDFKHQKTKPKPKHQANILPVLFKAFWITLLSGAFLKLLQDILTFASPQILKLLIRFVDGDEEYWKGYFYAFLLFFASWLGSLIGHQYFYKVILIGIRMRSTVVSAIYSKSLRISNLAREESTVGEIVNLMSVDAQRLVDVCTHLNLLWSAPFQIGLALYFLWTTLGPSVLSGVVVMILLIPINAVISRKTQKLQVKQMKNKDKRIKLMNEILSGIKVLKLYAWEPSFEKQIMHIRNRETKILKESAYLNAGFVFIWTCAPFLVSVVTFATYVLIDEKNVLDAQKAFVSLTLFNIMRMPLNMIPMVIVSFVQAAVSIKRINKFLNSEEIDPNSVTHDDDKDGNAVVIQNGTFAWNPSTIILKSINLRVKEGSLVAVVGSVGAGKSSLLSAILGEIGRISGRVNTKGSCAYVSQQAWIQNSSLKNNILFGRPTDLSKYDRVIEACALKPDLDILPAGDQTEIGERGINLSGGQKQRVALARATYGYSDLYLLDDVLSAVDAHVGKHLFEKVIGPNGLLKRKTRILVTHGVTYLSQMDQIFVVKDGEISETGTYKELLAKKGDFADFLLQHVAAARPEDEDGIEKVILQDLEEVMGSREEIRRRKSYASESESRGESYRRKQPSRQISTLSQDSKASRGSREHLSGSYQQKQTQEKNTLIEAETMESGSVKLSVFIYYLKAVGWTMAISTIMMELISQAFSMGSNIWLSIWSTSSGETGNGTMPAGERDMYLGVYAGLGIGQGCAVLASSIVAAKGTLTASSFLHKQMFRRIIRAPMSFFDTTPLGRVVNRFAKDVDTADNSLTMMLPFWLNCFFSVIATMIVISISTPLFIVVIIPVGIMYFLAQRYYVATLRQLKRLESVTRSPIYSHFSETLAGVSVIRAFTVQDQFMRESNARVDQNQACYFPSSVANRFLAVALETIGCAVVLCAALFAVTSPGSLSPGVVGLSVTYALQVTQNLNWLIRITSDIETYLVAIERLKEYGEVAQEADWEIPERKPSRSWPEAGEVVFKNYETRYREELDLVLRDVSCTIEAGEKVGIVGRTGAGKSSLTLALFRIIESSGGSIMIDGEDISKMGIHDLRRQITVIPQDPIIFSGTLRLNLDPFDEYTDDTVWRALELAHLKPFVKGLDKTLEYELTEGGDNLSQGQRQLVCLTRALLRKKKLFILDEATSGVDLETDDLIQQTIRSEFRDCTVLTIAHRINTIMDYTRVMVLDKGVIREFDTPANLLKDKRSMFYAMAKDDGLVS